MKYPTKRSAVTLMLAAMLVVLFALGSTRCTSVKSTPTANSPNSTNAGQQHSIELLEKPLSR